MGHGVRLNACGKKFQVLKRIKLMFNPTFSYTPNNHNFSYKVKQTCTVTVNLRTTGTLREFSYFKYDRVI